MFINIDIDNAEVLPENSIHQIETKISRNGKEAGKKAVIVFDYPQNKEYTYCFIYNVNEDEWRKGISLAELIHEEREVDIIDRRTPHEHTIELSRNGIRCLLFPARYDGKRQTYYLLEQKKDNITDTLQLLPTIRCTVRYEALKTGLFKLTSASQQKAIIRICGDAPISGTSLIYRCRGAGRERVNFGIDIPGFWNRELEIIIKKEEKIEILPPANKEYLLQIQTEQKK